MYMYMCIYKIYIYIFICILKNRLVDSFMEIPYC